MLIPVIFKHVSEVSRFGKLANRAYRDGNYPIPRGKYILQMMECSIALFLITKQKNSVKLEQTIVEDPF